MSGVVPVSVKRTIVSIDAGSVNVSEFCESHGISRWLFYDLRRRYRVEGDAALEPKSKAPKTVANKTPATVEDLIVELRKELMDQGWDAGPGSIRDRLCGQLSAGEVPSESTIWRILTARGFITPEPKKRPRRSAHRFERTRANELWQIDGTNRALAGGETIKIINVIDDASRVAVASRVHPEETLAAVWETLSHGASTWGLPEQVISDNAAGFIAAEGSLAQLGVAMTHSRPGHPQTCGKVERFHQTLHTWLDAQPPSATITELQHQLDTFTSAYNTDRPHRSIGRTTPQNRWNQLPKSGPANTPITTRSRVHTATADRQGRVTAGQQIRITLGTRHAHQQATTIINNTTAHTFIDGQHIRTTAITPNRNDYPLSHDNL